MNQPTLLIPVRETSIITERGGGAIGWLSHGSVVRFRNIRIRDLSAAR